MSAIPAPDAGFRQESVLLLAPTARDAAICRDILAQTGVEGSICRDDNRDAADSLATMLRLAGHDVRTAYDGQQAIDLAQTFRPSVALLDIGMPRVNGYDTAARIRAEPFSEGMVLVALTGWGQPEDKQRSQRAGFDHHLVKPVDPSVLDRLLGNGRPPRQSVLESPAP
ncbi:MAG: response regulator [Betaproteobacteria bacterium]|nr:response regulator [Betaproteobacteria bacterium]